MAVKREKLIKMAEQISDNMRFSDDAEQVAEKIADHINRFWDPRMRQSLLALSLEQQQALSSELQIAMKKVSSQEQS